MKKFTFVICLLTFLSVGFCGYAQAQFVAQWTQGAIPLPALPATCNPGLGSIVFDTSTNTLYSCTATNTWRPTGATGNGFIFNQGTITANTPVWQSTATWNAGAVTFEHFSIDITDTASAAGSLMANFEVGSATVFSIGKGGSLSLGPRTPAGIEVDFDVVGGVAQGVLLTHGDGTTVAFADLGAATNGTLIYCSDCTKATPCAGAGNGALAKRLNGAWDCD